jgi:hypothetical protein
MTAISIDAGIARLRQCLTKIKSLLAWRQLKSQEARPDRLFSFAIDDHVDEDLRSQCSLFMAMAMELKEMAGNIHAPKQDGKRALLRGEILKFEQEFKSLPIAMPGASSYSKYPQHGLF